MSAVNPRNAWWTPWLLLLATAAAPLPAQQAVIQSARRAPADLPTNRIIVKWREAGVAAVQIDSLLGRTARLRAATGMRLDGVRSVAARLDVVRLRDRGAEATMRDAVQVAVARLRADPSVEFAEADERIFILAAPDDPRYVGGSDAIGSWQGQWYLGDPSATAPAAIGAVTAWDTNQGANINVAVLDTGVVLDHPDLAGQFLVVKNTTTLIGRDFVCNDVLTMACDAQGSQYYTANDGDGWDANPADPGDWISAADLQIKDPNDATGTSYLYAGCGGGTNHDQPVDSSWHGTRVSGILAAATNNAIGIAGAAPGVHIMPVRIIGKCAGYTSDLVAALYWAGGLSNAVLGSLPAPSIHANIINLSLGNRLPCSQAEQDAINALNAASVLVVAAAGNDGGPVGAPANCTGVLSVAGIRHIGTKVGYSNISSTAAAVSIAAPAGNCINTGVNQPCLYSLDTLSNEGKTVPMQPSNALTSYTYSSFNAGYAGNSLNNANIGTSFASPLVSAVAAMMASVNGNLLPSEVIQRMQEASTPFPVPATAATGGICHVASLAQDSSGNYTDVQDRDCQCTTATCGAGMLNAPAAIAAALRPIAVFTPSSTSGSIGQRISVDGSKSLAAKGHTITGYQWSTDPGLSISNANGAVAEFVFPAFRPVSVTLTVTDEAGRRDSTSVKIESTVTASSSGSTSGGGAMGPELILLGLIAWRGTERRRKCRYACRIEQGR
jgi:serine protease